MCRSYQLVRQRGAVVSTSYMVGIAMVAYLALSLGYMLLALTRKTILQYAALGITAVALTTHTAAVTMRVIESGRLPLTNTYETLLLFSWILALISLWWENRYEIYTLGVFAFPLVFTLLAATSLPQISSEIQPMLPSLKSNWLLAHVLTCFLAYAAFGVAFVTSIIYLLLGFLRKKRFMPEKLELFDNITYKAIALGYPLFTLGIVTGAIWANSCWGRYWSWDPKEVWALVTWIVYSIFLHLRFAASWKGRWTAWAAIAGFVSVVFTYLGVNYLFTGLHSYV